MPTALSTATVRRSDFRQPGFRQANFYCPDVPRLAHLLIASCLLCSLSLTPGLARADSAYIIDELVVSLREAACGECRIVGPGMRSGQQVRILETGEGWTRVETAEGVAGWLPSRYLTSQPIARDQLAALREEIQRLEAENRKLGSSTPAATTDGTPVPAAPEGEAPMTGPAADTDDLYAQNQALLTRNQILQSEIDVLHATKEELQSNDVQRWFIFGGLLVSLGALLGTVLPLLKPKRRGYSEWS
ncbi:MAG: TIGR04211 family SH3 domain-containing protein [Porticoccaceae bacterium]